MSWVLTLGLITLRHVLILGLTLRYVLILIFGCILILRLTLGYILILRLTLGYILGLGFVNTQVVLFDSQENTAGVTTNQSLGCSF